MKIVPRLAFVVVAASLCVFAATSFSKPVGSVSLPNPVVDEAAKPAGSEDVVLAGGCFWGLQVVFEHVKGVSKVVSGYSGGPAKSANYEDVSTGETGHAESVHVTYDPSQVTFGQLLKVYFQVAHDPTELNRQGPDDGTQYRSSIFFESPEQQQVAEAYIAQLQTAKIYPHAIVTKVVPLEAFYPAEAYHQEYATLHPKEPYIAFYDLPKLAALKSELPDLYTAK